MTADMQAFEARVIGAFQHMQAVLMQKHEFYGDAPILEQGFEGIATKVGIKIARLKSLAHKKADFFSRAQEKEWYDAVKDTVLDIANYGVLGMLLLEAVVNHKEEL